LKRLILIFAAALFAANTYAASALDNAARAMSGMEASFTHRFTAKGFKTSQVENGTVVFGALPKMRWSYSKPEQKLFVFDGTSSWFYVPADKQVTLGRVTEARKRELPFLLLGKSIVTTLQPRDKSAVVKTVSVTIAPSTNLIQRIEYTDRDGNHTAFDFSGYHKRAASADTFTFKPPAGVQVINAD
jgi:outer membrane lipoprotein carrier protein